MATEKITIEPVTRIEGHAKVTIHMNDNGSVDHAYFHVNEFRGFEKFCEGRMYFEMPQITPRICGICPVSHHLASAKACDILMGAEPPHTAVLLRKLMHMGQIIQSHSMHFFELAGPDLILGFDADPAIRNVVGLIGADPELTVRAVQLRKFGQDIIYQVGGRRIHPNFAVPGGVNRAMDEERREHMLANVERAIETTQIGIKLIKDWADANIADVEKFAVFHSGYLGLVTPQKGLELYDGNIRLVDKDGKQLELFGAQNYLENIAEHVEDWSYLKFPYYKKMGWPDGVYRVGPLGRLNVAEKIDTPLAQTEFKVYHQINDGKPVYHTLYYHYARLIEVLFAIERARELLENPDLMGKDILNKKHDLKSEAVGVLEAPRGTLLHHYKVNPNGQLENVNLIVSTGHNNWAMSEAVDSVAKTYVKGPDVKEGMLNRVEAAIRAYDPCLSCSTHAIGQMPIKIDVVDPDGTIRQTLQRD